MNTTKTTRPGYWLRAIEYRKHELMREQRRAFRDTIADKARDGISDEDYATTLATLEKMARNLGYTEEKGVPRERGFGLGRRGFGHGHPAHHHGHGHEGHGPFGHRGAPRPFRDGEPEA